METTQELVAVPKSGVERLSYEDSRTSVFSLETERERLLAKLNPNHPEVQQIEKQLQRVRSALQTMDIDRTESAMEPNPVYQSVKTDLMRAETEYAASQARLKSLRENRDRVIAKLAELNAAQIASDRLERKVEVARQYLSNYTHKRGELMLMSKLDAREVSDLAVAQEASLGLKHISPKGSIVLQMGLRIPIHWASFLD